jgi:hypothetical protein
MVVANRNLKPGTRLIGRYHKQEHTCEIIGSDDKLVYRVNGKDFNSPSAAGTSVTNHGCNGWAFWTEASPKEAVTETAPAETKLEAGCLLSELIEKPATRLIRKVPNQKGVPEDQVRWFCPACAKSFMAPKERAPEVCPEGHPANGK